MSGAGSDSGVAGRLVFSRTPAGNPVAECELAAGDTGLLSELARQAACHGAVLLWVHCAADLSKAGFAARQGYRRFTTAAGRRQARVRTQHAARHLAGHCLLTHQEVARTAGHRSRGDPLPRAYRAPFAGMVWDSRTDTAGSSGPLPEPRTWT